MILRAALGLAAALIIALIARRSAALSGSGAIAAAVVGGISAAAGWDWAILLLAFFVPSTLLSRIGAETKARKTDGILARRGARDAWQVAANGGVFAAAAAFFVLSEWPGWLAVGAGSLGAAAADTWATEVGVLAGGVPRRIDTLAPVPPGTSGAVSLAGLVAMALGAGFMAAAAGWLGWPSWSTEGTLVGGVLGALADSALGARMQARRRCPACDSATEREVHGCGERTVYEGGLRWMDNDAVNVLAALTGAAVAALFVP